jgi:hypothetical protein
MSIWEESMFFKKEFWFAANSPDLGFAGDDMGYEVAPATT